MSQRKIPQSFISDRDNFNHHRHSDIKFNNLYYIIEGYQHTSNEIDLFVSKCGHEIQINRIQQGAMEKITKVAVHWSDN